MSLPLDTLADLPKGTVVTFDRARARHSPAMGDRLWFAEMWTTEGIHYVCSVEADTPPTLHEMIDHAQAEPDAWFRKVKTPAA